jgi:hypothetical protein
MLQGKGGSSSSSCSWIISESTCFGYLSDGKPAHGGTVARYIFGEIVLKIAKDLRRKRWQIAVRSTAAMAL